MNKPEAVINGYIIEGVYYHERVATILGYTIEGKYYPVDNSNKISIIAR